MDIAKEHIVDMEESRLRAMREYDVDTLETVLDDSFSFTHMNGLFETKQQFLGRLRERGALYHPAQLSDLACATFDGAAVLTGRVASKVEIPATGAVFDMRNRFISVWVRVDGEWRSAAYQSTPLPPGE